MEILLDKDNLIGKLPTDRQTDRQTDRRLRVLVACEESQAVCIEFRKLGHEAYSCDLVDCSGGHDEWHLKVDALQMLKMEWDLIIAHPPCTYLSNAGACRLFPHKGQIDQGRYEKGLAAKEVFLQFLNANCEHIAVENPIPSGIYGLPKYTQIIQPYEYGHPYSKKTCLWLKGLPNLMPTDIVEPKISWVSGGSKKPDGTPRSNKGMTFRDSKRKSKTFPGIAKAMADQFSHYILYGEKQQMDIFDFIGD